MSMRVRDIIHVAGGAKALAEYARKHGLPAPNKPVAEKTIYSWLQNGIPERHWDWVARACKVKPEQLYMANRALRAEKLSQSQSQSS